MATPSQRLRALGLQLPAVPEPVAAYVPAVREGDLIYTSGQLPFVHGALPLTGVVGASPSNVSVEAATDLARTAALNALAAAAELAGGIDNIERIIKLTGYVASAVPTAGERFTAQPSVINGASELLGEVFGAAGNHARAAVGVAALPADAPVELDLIVKVRSGV